MCLSFVFRYFVRLWFSSIYLFVWFDERSKVYEITSKQRFHSNRFTAHFYCKCRWPKRFLWALFSYRGYEESWRKLTKLNSIKLATANPKMDVSKVPPSLKAISAYLKVANEYDKRDAVVAYFCEYGITSGRFAQLPLHLHPSWSFHPTFLVVSLNEITSYLSLFLSLKQLQRWWLGVWGQSPQCHQSNNGQTTRKKSSVSFQGGWNNHDGLGEMS